MVYIKRYGDINEKNFFKNLNNRFEDYLNSMGPTNDGNKKTDNSDGKSKSVHMSDLFIDILLKMSNVDDIDKVNYSKINTLLVLLFKLYRGEIDKKYIKTNSYHDYLSFNSDGQITYLETKLRDANDNKYMNNDRQVSSSLLKTLRTILTDEFIEENKQIPKSDSVKKSYLKKGKLMSIKRGNKQKMNEVDIEKINKLIDNEQIEINKYTELNNKQPLINNHFELFSNGVKVFFDDISYKIKIMSGDEIEPTFDENNVTIDCKESSCLTDHVNTDSGFFDLYRNNKEARSLIVYDETKSKNNIIGRRMIFTGKQIGNHGIFKDGVEYTVANLFYGHSGRGGVIDIYLNEWCKKNNIILINELNSSVDFFRIKLTNTNVKVFPPMDKIAYINPFDNELSNHNFGKDENNDHWVYIKMAKTNHRFRHIKKLNETIDIKSWERFFSDVNN